MDMHHHSILQCSLPQETQEVEENIHRIHHDIHQNKYDSKTEQQEDDHDVKKEDSTQDLHSDPLQSVSSDRISNQRPWSTEKLKITQGIQKSRFRQHVNPLARKFQLPADLSNTWPNNGTFVDPSLPLHIDIGCAKGGFLLNLASCQRQISQPKFEENVMEEEEENLDTGSTHSQAQQGEPTPTPTMKEEQQIIPTQTEKRNYLGLEIRPSVAQFAKQRIPKWGLTGTLDFIGCNANVDLDRILTKYTSYGGNLAFVSIQFPDPHFKKHHHKRRVVTPQLVATLIKFLPEGREIFIQSDVKEVLDHMRITLREEGGPYFQDCLQDLEEYLPENPIGVLTEREVSVLKKNLPVYRTIFRRTNVAWPATS